MPTPMGGFLPQCVSLKSGGGAGPVGHLRIRPPDPWLAYSPVTSKCASGNQCPGKAENRGLTRDEPPGSLRRGARKRAVRPDP